MSRMLYCLTRLDWSAYETIIRASWFASGTRVAHAVANPNPVPPPEHTRWKPGVSPNPGGRPTGSRNRLTGDFLRDLADVYAAKGKQVLEKCADEDPRTLNKAFMALCPK